MTNDARDRIVALTDKTVASLDRARPVALLLGRLAVGLLFVSTGWSKVHDLAKVTSYFASLGIPAPGVNAVVVAYSELLGGAALVVGAATRLATIPLVVTMIVALLTARREHIHGLFELVEADELTYLVVLIMIAILGPGSIAVDHWLAKRLRR